MIAYLVISGIFAVFGAGFITALAFANDEEPLWILTATVGSLLLTAILWPLIIVIALYCNLLSYETQDNIQWYFWKFVHNTLIHPLLGFPYEPKWLQKAHDWTALRCKGGG